VRQGARRAWLAANPAATDPLTFDTVRVECSRDSEISGIYRVLAGCSLLLGASPATGADAGKRGHLQQRALVAYCSTAASVLARVTNEV
jgi:hypothetical protein